MFLTMVVLAGLSMATPVDGQLLGAVRTVDRVDLDRYLGDWYEVTRFPNGVQRTSAGDA